jgi:O-antigen biosynthesis protein
VITVVSSCYGGYDDILTPPVQDVPVRWVMVTEGAVQVPEPWEHVVVESDLHPRLAAKVPKCFPHRYADGPVIWLDASAKVNSPTFASDCVNTLGDGDVAQWEHPQRDCILPEAAVSATMPKYRGLPVEIQAAHYINSGHPQNYGLWATGCMVWAGDWLHPERVGEAWFDEQTRWTYQDQLSWPFIVRRYQLDIRPLPGMLWDQQMVTFRPHASVL